MSNTKIPIVAIVGRANVGKSSLFNSILGRREAIVAKEAGTTRDSVFAKASVFLDPENNQTSIEKNPKNGKFSPRRDYTPVEKEQYDFWLVDTAGVKDAADDFEFTIQEQIAQAADSADIIWVVIESDVNITEEDRRVAKMALKTKKPVVLVVNKIDKNVHATTSDFQRLGIKDIFLTATTQNRGIDGLLKHLIDLIPQKSFKTSDEIVRVALIGRPNVGKSFMFNSLAKKQQAIVADVAGTTRDINRTSVMYNKREVMLMDTAGIRRNGRIEVGIESFSVIRSLSAIEESDICLLLIDANDLHVALDQKLAGAIKDAGKGLILVISKWDSLEEKTPFTRDEMAARLKHTYDFVPWASLIFTSSITGQNITKIFELIEEIYEARTDTTISTATLNRWLKLITERHPPAGLKNRSPKLNYIVQEKQNPTNFKIYGAHTKFLHWSYKRYMEKQLRDEFGFAGTAIKFWYFEKHETHKHGQSPTKD